MGVNQILELSKTMLQHAKSEQWQDLDDLQLKQTVLLQQFFEGLDGDITEKEQQDLLIINQLNQVMVNLLEKNKQALSGQLLKLKHDKAKIKAYQEKQL